MLSARSVMGVPACLLLALTANAAVVSFDTSNWDHGSGSQLGWNDGEFSGTTSILGADVTITTTNVGTAVNAVNHFRRIDETFFSGFAIQMIPATNGVTNPLTNYNRIDFTFTNPVILESITLTDVDRAGGQWYDLIATEAFTTTTPGALGTGISPNYTVGSNVFTVNPAPNFNSLDFALPFSNTGNVQNDPTNDVTISFTDPIDSFSIYYLNNGGDNQAGTQTIGIRGNQFIVSVVPEPFAGVLVSLALTAAAFRRRRREQVPSRSR